MDISVLRSRLKAGEKVEGHLIRKALISTYGLKWPQVEYVRDGELRRLLGLDDAALGAAVEALRTAPPRRPKGGEDLMSSIANLVVNAIRDGGLDETLKERVSEMIPPRPTLIIDERPTPPVIAGEGVRHPMMKVLYKVYHAGVPCMLVGPPGTGKSAALSCLTKDVGAAGYEYDACTEEMSRVQLLGQYLQGTGKLIRTPLRRAMERGLPYMADEGDAGNSNSSLVYNTLLSNRELSFPDRIIKESPGFWFIMGANTWGRGGDAQFTGRNALDFSTRTRFFGLEWGMDRDFIKSLVGLPAEVKFVDPAKGGVPTLKEWEELAWRYIQACLRQREGLTLSPRCILLAPALIAQGIGMDLLMEGLIWQGLDMETRERVTKEAMK